MNAQTRSVKESTHIHSYCFFSIKLLFCDVLVAVIVVSLRSVSSNKYIIRGIHAQEDHFALTGLGVYTEKILVTGGIFNGFPIESGPYLMISAFCFAARTWLRPYRK